MTLDQFYNNPSGKGNVALNISALQKSFSERYASIYQKISCKIFFVDNDCYYLVNIPSSVDGIFYDVVVMFEDFEKIGSIKDANIKLFSNSPSFVYTYANVYNKNKLLIDSLKKKIDKDTYKKAAYEKNPYHIVSYDFSIFCALKFIIINNIQPSKNVSKIKLSTFVSLVKNFEDVQSDRSQKKQLQMLANAERNSKHNSEKAVKDISKVKKSKSITSIKSTKKVKSIKKVKEI